MGLNESYAATRGQILLMDPLPTVSRTYALVLQEERHRSVSTPPAIEGIALAATNYPPRKASRLGPSKKSLKCTHCGKDGHTVDRCYRIHGFPSSPHNSKPGPGPKHSAHHVSSTSSLPFTPEQCQQLLAILNNSASSQPMAHQVGSVESSLAGMSNHDPLWILDSGATDHMVCTPTVLTHSFPIHGRTVQLPNGSHVTVTHIGSVCFSSTLTLDNVLCVPNFHFNLISVRKLCKTHHCLIIFSSDFCFIQDLRLMKMIGMGTERDGLYHFANTRNACCQVATSTSSSHIWHQRLGHLSNKALSFLSNNIPEICSSNLEPCLICPLAKQTRAPFPASSISSLNLLTYCMSIFGGAIAPLLLLVHTTSSPS